MAKPAPQKTSAPNPTAILIDELGELRKELAPWRAKLAKEEKLTKLLRATAKDWPANEQRVLQGTRFDALVGACTYQTSVNMATLLKSVTTKVFNAVVFCTQEALKRNEVAPEIIAQVIETKQTGWRPLDIFEKNANPNP